MKLLTNFLVVLGLLLRLHFVFHIADDIRVNGIVFGRPSIVDILHQGVHDQLLDSLLPLQSEKFGHHLGVQSFWQKTQHLYHFRSLLELVFQHIQRNLHRSLHHLVHFVSFLQLAELIGYVYTRLHQ